MATLALAFDRRTEDRLLGAIVQGGHEVLARVHTAGDLIQAIEKRPAEIVLVASTRRVLTSRVIAACDARGIRLVALAATDLERRHAASLGLYEVLDAAAEWNEIEDLLSAGVTVPPRVGATGSPGSRSGTVIAVWGPAGAPGRTTLAINVAAEIAAHGHTVALADVDTYSGSLAPALGMLDEAPGFAAACRLAGSDNLNQAELERVAGRYSSPRGAFWVLTGIGRPARWPELNADRVRKTIEACRHWADYVVVDTGFSLENDEEISSDIFAPRRNAATLASLQAADRIVAVGVADPVGMSRFLRAHDDLIEVVGDTPVSVVMNRVRASAIGLSPFSQVSSTLARFGGIERPVLVPHDQHSLDTAILTGRTLRDAAPKSPARAGILRFVEGTLLPAPEAAKEHARRRRRKIREAATA